MQKRLFIAIDPDPELLDKIFKLISTIKREYPLEGMRFTHPQNLHLTLQFLGDTDEALIANIVRSLDKICQKHTEFNLSFAGLGAFPSRKNPRILWLGVTNPNHVTALAQAIIIDGAFLAESEKAKFSPHLTLGRIPESSRGISAPSFASLFNNLGNVTVGSTPVREVLLYQSTLKPEGPVYNLLSRHSLKKVC